MLTARMLDEYGEQLVREGRIAFHLSGAGHEACVTLAETLSKDDWVHCHYRDKALLVHRGLPLEAFLQDLLSTGPSPTAGRRLPGFFGDATRNLLSPVIPVGNQALPACGIAAEIRDDPGEPIVVCGLGDGASQQGEVLEGIAEAVRSNLPVLFWIEDNGLAISTRTAGQTFYDLPSGPAESYLGIPIHRIDGRDPAACRPFVHRAVAHVRKSRGPGIVIFQVERLANHSNADDERVYRGPDELDCARNGDPIANLEARMLAEGTSESTLANLRDSVRKAIHQAAERARLAPPPTATPTAKRALPVGRVEQHGPGPATLTMVQAIRGVLADRLAADPRVTLAGQDIEDPKGDVFGLTRGLSTRFPDRVKNAALSESTIVGMAAGRALAGGRPVAFVQFADFLPLAMNQIICELSTMHWRSAGEQECPVVIIAPCGAYRAGLGEFHSHTHEALAAHLPGLDVVMPSHAADAAGLLNAAFESRRPTLMLVPKVLLNDSQRLASDPIRDHFVPLGTARKAVSGKDITLVGWGNTVPILEQVAATLASAHATVDVLDLRSLSPWDRDGVVASVRASRRLIVVHEDNITGGFGAEVVAHVCEHAGVAVQARRIARPDTYVPCHHANQLELLPSYRRVLEASCEMLKIDLTWQATAQRDDGALVVPVPAPSATAQTVTLVAWHVEAGDEVKQGQTIAEIGGDKAVVEVAAPNAGIVKARLIEEGATADIGEPMMVLSLSMQDPANARVEVQQEFTPRLDRLPSAMPSVVTTSAVDQRVGLGSIAAMAGSRRVTNADLCRHFPGRTSAEAESLTGIQARGSFRPDDDLIAMATAQARRVLERDGLSASELSAVIVSTTTPLQAAPSMACRLLGKLSENSKKLDAPAWDLSAACSGYIYALASAQDHLRVRPSGVVLLVTVEALSRVVDPHDFDTAVLFGDGVSASLVYGSARLSQARYVVHTPVLGTEPDIDGQLVVPTLGNGFITMNGQKTFSTAVRRMSAALREVCESAETTPAGLKLIIPHQANARILEAVRKRLDVPADRVLVDMAQTGNTSSSSIPLALLGLDDARFQPGDHLGLCAFGSGFTYGACLLERVA
jgi:2-oxoisovalerate dehydrogenase E1 component